MFQKKKSTPGPVAAPDKTVALAAPSPAERAAQVEVELTAARGDLATAETDLANARADYDAAVRNADIEAALAARPRIAEAETVVAVAQRVVERFAAEHAAACDGLRTAAELAERERLRAEAEESAREYETVFRELPEAETQFRKVLRAWAKAQLAHEAAADAGITLPSVDHFRHVPGRPREDIRSWERDMWIDAAGNPYEGRFQEAVKLQNDGTGRLYGASHTTTVTKKRRFRFTEYRPRIDTEIAPLLAQYLAIPSLFAGSPAGYANPNKQNSVSPRDVLARLDAIEKAQASPPTELPTKIERKPIEPARAVAGEGVVKRVQHAPVFTRSMYGID